MAENKRSDIAADYFYNGFNCCQAVLMAFSDKVNMSKEELAAIGKAMGRGMGGMKATCGALVAAGIVLGLEGKTPGYSKKVADEFENICGATVCSDLKGAKTGKVLTPCEKCVRTAAMLCDEAIK